MCKLVMFAANLPYKEFECHLSEFSPVFKASLLCFSSLLKAVRALQKNILQSVLLANSTGKSPILSAT